MIKSTSFHATIAVPFVLIGGLLAGCGGSSTDPTTDPRVAISASEDVVLGAGPINVTFSNLQDSEILLGHCPQTLERQERSTWVVASTDFSCDAVLNRLAPGERLVVAVDFPLVERGVYRLRFDVRDTARTLLPAVDRVSNAFNVR